MDAITKSQRDEYRTRAEEIMSCTIGSQTDREYITRNLLRSEHQEITASYAGYLAHEAYKNAKPIGVVAASLMGSITSDLKAASSRENGKRGGRPRKA